MVNLNSDDLDLKLPDGLSVILAQMAGLGTLAVAPHLRGAVDRVMPVLMISGAQLLLASLNVALPPCNLDAPPAAVFITIDSRTKNYRFECKHPSPHCWGLDGKYSGC
jgi:hypothetical protein